MSGCPVHCPRSGSGTATVALAAVSLAVVVTSAAALVSSILAAVLTVAAVVCLAGAVTLGYLLRRDGLRLRSPSARGQPPLRLVASRPAQTLPAPRRLAIEAARQGLAGLDAGHGYDVIRQAPRD